MPDFRSYSPQLFPDTCRITLSPEESHHLVSVNRARQNDPVVVFDGLGNEWLSVIAKADRKEAILEGKKFSRHSPSPFNIGLAQSIPKSKGLENIIRKATELGIQHIFPIISERTESKIRSGKEKAKNGKWLSAAIEGAKQSGNPFLPVLHPAQTLEQFLEKEVSRFELKLVASLEKDSGGFPAPKRKDRDAEIPSGLFLIGPEGDFSESEYTLIRQTGFHPVSLGPFVLKCETAAVKALSILQHELAKP